MGPLGLGLGVARTGRRGEPEYRFAPPAPIAGVAVARASPASVVRADRSLAVEDADTPRFDHDPATGAFRGLLIEPAGVNLLVEGDPFAWLADWGGAGAEAVGAAGGTTTAPDGSAVPWLRFARGEGFARLSTPAPTERGTAYTLSIWLKGAAAGPGPALRIESIDGGALSLATDWRRYSFTAVPGGGTASCQLLLWANVAGSPAEAVLAAWGAQFEAGEAATSTMNAPGAGATRAHEQLALDWGRFGAADGPCRLRCTLETGDQQDVDAVVTGGVTIMPDAPAPMRLRSVALLR